MITPKRLNTGMSSLMNQNPRYRKAKPITDDIRRHCHIFFDEGLFINALNFLILGATTTTAIISQSENTSDNHNLSDAPPAFAPSPFHIELVSVLLIHPRYTNHAAIKEEYSEIASRSLVFLRCVLAILGPINAELGEAFSFNCDSISRDSSEGNLNSAKLNFDESTLREFDNSNDKNNQLKCGIANHGRTRRCAKDFWQVVGWSFNCSLRYPERWKYLKVWLDYMLDVLEADFQERERLDLELMGLSSHPADEGQEHQLSKFLSKSLIVSHLSGVHGKSTAARRIVHSIFADGDKNSLKSFPQVFPNETKILKTFKGQGLRNKDWKSYFSTDYEQDFDVENFQLSPNYHLEEAENDFMSKDPCMATAESWMGGPEAVILRQRLINLLSNTAKKLPCFFIEYSYLQVLLYDFIRPLPLSVFSFFLSCSDSSHISEVVYVSLCQMLLSRLLPRCAPNPTAFITNNAVNDSISQFVLEKCYLSFAALTSSSHDNAAVSIIVENLLRLLIKKKACHYSTTLKSALENGITTREEKIKKQRKRPLGNNFDEDAVLLKASGIRLRTLLSWLKKLSDRDDGDLPTSH
ncbi:hypothetical protein GcC1_102005 [Golovinomyces cichoracearum]|uniref:Major facilitator superfamily transporter n=1 Tax=Golovinomyces cichoracearum TaxID=62708 RepID=A0A420IA14_9PEZI|nr:hypothetical protein GcC1_102005 [Golovinomyces cichoracearum]